MYIDWRIRTCGGGTRGGSVLLDIGLPRTSLELIGLHELHDLSQNSQRHDLHHGLNKDLRDKLVCAMSGGGKE